MTSLVPMCTRKTLCTIWRAPLRTIFRETKQKQLARAYARNDPDAEDKVEKIFENASTFLAIDTIVKRARAGKAEELAEKYVRRDPDAIKLVDEVLAGASVNIDDFTAKKVADQLADIEQIDRLATIAESRRNTSLREIDRRRAVLGETLRRTVKEVRGRRV